MPFSLAAPNDPLAPFSLHEDGTSLAIPAKTLQALFVVANAKLHELASGRRRGAVARTLSPELDVVTRVLLLQIPEHAMAGNVRRELLLQRCEGLAKTARRNAVDDELDIVAMLLRVDPVAKSSVLWHHRRWLLAWLASSEASPPLRRAHLAPAQLHRLSIDRFDAEFELIARCVEIYPRNYGAWSHRHFLHQSIELALASGGEAIGDYRRLLERERTRIEARVATSVADASAALQLQRLSGALADDAAAFEDALDAVERYPERETPWLRLRMAICGDAARLGRTFDLAQRVCDSRGINEGGSDEARGRAAVLATRAVLWLVHTVRWPSGRGTLLILLSWESVNSTGGWAGRPPRPRRRSGTSRSSSPKWRLLLRITCGLDPPLYVHRLPALQIVSDGAGLTRDVSAA